MNKFEINKQRVKHAVAKGVETLFTSLFCSAVVLSPGKSRVSDPEVVHSGNGKNDKPIPLPEHGVVYFPKGISARTVIDGSLTVINDFSTGVTHAGRAELKTSFDRPVRLDRAHVPVSVGRNGARAMYTQLPPEEITDTHIAILKGEAK